MNRAVPYIILIVVALAALVLVFTGDKEDSAKRFNDRITLHKRDKIPYGTYIAFQNLKHLFPAATISVNREEPGYWDSLYTGESNQALVIVSPRFFADEPEMRKLISFIENGNNVFVSTMVLSDDVKSMMNCSISFLDLNSMFGNDLDESDTLTVALTNPPFAKSYNYSYPGQRFDSYFYSMDTSISTILGRRPGGHANFIKLSAGKGNLFVHLAPLTFSNYFLLHRDNINYFESVMSVIPPNTRHVVWDEYYLNKRFYYENEDDRAGAGWFNALMGYPGLKWALLTAILTLALYILFEMRRKQRYIPVIARPRNDSLDFVKTIGRLYFDKGDHRNLAHKMGAYFLEHVRNKYKIPTGNLDDAFAKRLLFKTGYPETELNEILDFIRQLQMGNTVTSKQLSDFHKKLEIFYQKA